MVYVQEDKMGINKEFNFGIKLYTFSFAFSNLTYKSVEKISNKGNWSNIKFLGALSKELFDKPKKIKNSDNPVWVMI